jgi:hypothetical protein
VRGGVIRESWGDWGLGEDRPSEGTEKLS